MITIRDVEEVLSHYPFLKKPRHVIIFDTPTIAIQKNKKKALLRGFQPSWRDDVIFLTPFARIDTITHESFHMVGAGETLASLFGYATRLDYAVQRFVPRFIKKRLRIRYSPVKYKRCLDPNCDVMREFKRIIEMPPGALAKHYVLVREDRL